MCFSSIEVRATAVSFHHPKKNPERLVRLREICKMFHDRVRVEYKVPQSTL